MFTATFPKAMLTVLVLNVGVYAFSSNPKVLDTPLAFAVKVAACVVVTETAVAVNAALVALAGTVTTAGTVTAATLLDRLTANPPVGAAAVSVTVQIFVPEPVMAEALQVNPPRVLCAPVTAPVAVPLSAMEA